MWVLVFIWFDGIDPVSKRIGEPYDDMVECFYAREKLALDLGSVNGFYPKGTNALCISMPEENA